MTIPHSQSSLYKVAAQLWDSWSDCHVHQFKYLSVELSWYCLTSKPFCTQASRSEKIKKIELFLTYAQTITDLQTATYLSDKQKDSLKNTSIKFFKICDLITAYKDENNLAIYRQWAALSLTQLEWSMDVKLSNTNKDQFLKVFSESPCWFAWPFIKENV